MLKGVCHRQRKSAEKDALLSLGLLWLTLACYCTSWFVSGGGCACYWQTSTQLPNLNTLAPNGMHTMLAQDLLCCTKSRHTDLRQLQGRQDKKQHQPSMCMLSSFLFVLYLGKSGENSSDRVTKARKDSRHTSRQSRNATEDTATCHTRPQASLHKCKAAGINEGKQEHKNQVKNTNEYCSKNCWMEIVIDQRRSLEEAKQKKARAGCRNLSSTTTASKPKQADIIQCALSTSAWGRTPYKLLLLRCEVILQRVNCHL